MLRVQTENDLLLYGLVRKKRHSLDCRSAVVLRARNDAQPVGSSLHVGRRPSLGPGVTISFHIRTVLPSCSSLGGLQPNFSVFLCHKFIVVGCGRCFVVHLDESLSVRTPSHCLYALTLISDNAL